MEHTPAVGRRRQRLMCVWRVRADLKCWAFSPPGGLVSDSLLPALSEWCVSVVCGKDAVPRMTVNNLARLMDEMITALARARCAA